MLKKCNHCKVIKPFEDFSKNKRMVDGINLSCKACNNERRRVKKGTYWKEKLKESNEKYCPTCEIIKPMDEFSNAKPNKDGKYGYCKVCKSESDKKYMDQLKEKGVYKDRRREEYLRNIETYKNYEKNKVRDYKKEYRVLRKCKLRTLKYNLRNRIHQAFKYRNWAKNKSTAILLGCTFQHAKQHIDEQFTDGMNWDNYGEWHMDHIIPLGSAKTKEELILLFNYKNIQPLWKIDNLRKGSRI